MHDVSSMINLHKMTCLHARRLDVVVTTSTENLKKEKEIKRDIDGQQKH